MIKIALTGSIASGKTTASKIISKKRGPLFSADKVVKKLYTKSFFKRLIGKKLNIKTTLNIKKEIIKKISSKNNYLEKLEKIIHPFVRKEMQLFLKKNKKKNFIFFEIPLLIESKLVRYFDVIIFIKSKKSVRLQRYKANGGKIKLFSSLNRRQLKDTYKMKFCKHIIVNNKSLVVLKKNLFNIIKLYE